MISIMKEIWAIKGYILCQICGKKWSKPSYLKEKIHLLKFHFFLNLRPSIAKYYVEKGSLPI